MSHWTINDIFLPHVRMLHDVITTRLLPTFSSISDEAEAKTQEIWASFSSTSGEDDDPSIAAEAATDIGVNHYMLLDSTRQGLVNLFAVALNHLFEQQCLYLLRREFLPPRLEHDSQFMKLSCFTDQLRERGIDVGTLEMWPTLLELRVVANVVKHADGHSATELRRLRPDLFLHPELREDPWPRQSAHSPVYQPLAGDDLYLSVADLNNYFEAAIAFWVTVDQGFAQAVTP